MVKRFWRSTFLFIAFLLTMELRLAAVEVVTVDSLQLRLKPSDRALIVAAARRAGLDTTLTFRNARQYYHRQLSRSFLIDTLTIDSLVLAEYRRLQQCRDAGKVTVSHIFRYLPQTVTPSTLRREEALMDSLYQVLQQHPNRFEEMVECFSAEKKTFQVSRLSMPVEFEEKVFAMRPGEISAPFFTPQGLHLVRVWSCEELPSFEQAKPLLAERVACRELPEPAVKQQLSRLKELYCYVPSEAAIRELKREGKTDAVLFTLDGVAYTGAQFARFAASHPMGLARQFDAFVTKSVFHYAGHQLETAQPLFARQLGHFSDSLLVTAMLRQVIAHPGNHELAAYFEKHRASYRWEAPRYRGIVLHATSKKTARRVRRFLKKLPSAEWKEAIRLAVNADGAEEIIYEQGTFRKGENTFVDEVAFGGAKAALHASHPFTVVIGRKLKGPEDYSEVIKSLRQDCRQYLLQNWLKRLRAGKEG